MSRSRPDPRHRLRRSGITGSGERLGTVEYEAFLSEGDADFAWSMPGDEWDAIALNYTSGTTGDPKGVVYHHRGAYLLAMGNIVVGSMGQHPVYLWTLPMFHGNLVLSWSLSIVAGTHVCLRAVRAKPMWTLLPTMPSRISAAPPSSCRRCSALRPPRAAAAAYCALLHGSRAAAGGGAGRHARAGFDVTHLYGLTECYGPAVVNEWHQDWENLDAADYAARKARQGVRYPVLEALDVRDPDTMQPVPANGALRGGHVPRQRRDERAIDERLRGGWFRSGDLGVKYPDGYILKDRSKDIIISGGENISSIEVEDALFKHPAVQLAAVVASPTKARARRRAPSSSSSRARASRRTS